MMRRALPGPFTAVPLGQGRWLLTHGFAATQVYLSGPRPAADRLGEHSIVRLDLDWQPGTVVVVATGPASVRRVEADSVIIHEPMPRLYDALPLAGLDARARRFWRRVFLLMRIPGGRWLLRMIARSR